MGLPQLPHFGRSATRSMSTRFSVPQKGHATVAVERVSVEVMRSSSCRQDTSDRKSTRLNSSHSQISYAVFCLKKKKKQKIISHTKNKIYLIISSITYTTNHSAECTPTKSINNHRTARSPQIRDTVYTRECRST